MFLYINQTIISTPKIYGLFAIIDQSNLIASTYLMPLSLGYSKIKIY
jgi:hypothetical protein